MISTDDYIDVTLDFGFKRLFQDDNVLIRFINSVLKLPDQVQTIKCRGQSAPYSPVSKVTQERKLSKTQIEDNESQIPISLESSKKISNETHGESIEDESIRYDLVCLSRSDAQIKVQIQKYHFFYHYDSDVFYSARLISQQGQARVNEEKSLLQKAVEGQIEAKPTLIGKSSFNLGPTYRIGILDSSFVKPCMYGIPDSFKDCWLIWSQFMFHGDRSRNPVNNAFVESEQLVICLISLPQFQKVIADNVSEYSEELEKFLWILANFGKKSQRPKSIPHWLSESDFFKDVIDKLKFRKLSYQEREIYETCLKNHLTLEGQMMTYRAEGYDLGKIEGKAQGIDLGIELGIELGIDLGIACIQKFYELKNSIGDHAAYLQLIEESPTNKAILQQLIKKH